ncbi:MAG TPA: ester cyclase [Steroidobacteraceae bacterium]|nr:ester cyclase [Steroidobacteraceae bacterium]
MATKKSKRGRSGSRTRVGRKAGARRPAARTGAKARVAGKSKAARVVRRVRSKTRAVAGAVADRLALNKKLVLEFYQKLIGEKDFEAARPYMGSLYRQHAPYAADGHEGVAEWVRKFKEAFPQHHYEVKKVIAEGDFVVLHLHGKSGLHPFGESVVDIFRIEDGKVVEHWDVIQPIPETADNANSMF